ncbi:hypothetical protein Tsp_10321 [Trichinella spiralis]|uniref:hypothetical protein n=1 Tax=Trichinella spiralis TaxID=6334 RepID=UPI0001EFE372|nr:hypothetical protein Tsp_10321 [Trichinella spiralis]
MTGTKEQYKKPIKAINCKRASKHLGIIYFIKAVSADDINSITTSTHALHFCLKLKTAYLIQQTISTFAREADFTSLSRIEGRIRYGLLYGMPTILCYAQH